MKFDTDKIKKTIESMKAELTKSVNSIKINEIKDEAEKFLKTLEAEGKEKFNKEFESISKKLLAEKKSIENQVNKKVHQELDRLKDFLDRQKGELEKFQSKVEHYKKSTSTVLNDKKVQVKEKAAQASQKANALKSKVQKKVTPLKSKRSVRNKQN